MTGTRFLAYVERCLAPTLKQNEIVVGWFIVIEAWIGLLGSIL